MASHPTVSSAMANHDPQSSQPTCQNCSTSTTPLWRRDEMGSVLCNACGLFLKLHGRPRPISLKTDVIKSRNRVKTMRPDMAMKKKQSLPASHADQNGHMHHSHDSATATALAAVRRASQQHKANGHGDDTNSPVSRTGTPSMYDPHLPVFQGMDGHQYQSPSLPQYAIAGGSPGRAASPTNGDQHAELPQTHEQLIAANSSLKTRVSELDLINELYRGRLSQLEQEMQNQDNYRHQAEQAAKGEAEALRKQEETQKQLEDSHRRENILKRRLDEMEQELELNNAANKSDDKIDDKLDEKLDGSEPPAKRMRTEEKTEESDALSDPMSTA